MIAVLYPNGTADYQLRKGQTMARNFLRISSLRILLLQLSLFIISASGLIIFACNSPEKVKRLRFLALTDTHIAADSDLARWRDFLYTIRDREIEFVVVLGDLVGHAPEFIEPVKEIAERIGPPVYFLPGNHDDNYTRNTEWWTSVFGSPYYRFEYGGYHFIMNWSQDKDGPLGWLQAVLDSIPQGVPIVFCQHYPPQSSGAPDSGSWPILESRSEEVVVALSGHIHRRTSETVGSILSETLDNCSMDTTKDGHFYEITLKAEELVRIEEFSLSELKTVSSPDNPPIVSLVDTSGYFVIDQPLTLTGTAQDDNAVALVQWRIDYGRWSDAQGTEHWQLRLDPADLSPGHHMLWARARDNTGQASAGFERAILYLPEEGPQPGTVRLSQGLAGYTPCRDVTVRAHAPEVRAEGSDLECWIHGEAGSEEFSEFYIAFNLSPINTGRKVKEVRLILFCSRQNSVSPADGDDLYRVGVVGGPWSEDMNFNERPHLPGWYPAKKAAKARLEDEWPVPSGMQEIRPEVPLTLDLTEFAAEVEKWIKEPGSNHGWVISPLFDEYNISFRSSEYKIPTMRPRLEIVFQR